MELGETARPCDDPGKPRGSSCFVRHCAIEAATSNTVKARRELGRLNFRGKTSGRMEAGMLGLKRCVVRALFTSVVGSVALAGGLAPAAYAELKPDAKAAAKGATLYVRYCASCHGPAGRGDGPLANDLRVPVPDLTTLSTRGSGAYPYERVVRIVQSGEVLRGHGNTDMPAWGDAFKRTKGIGAETPLEGVRSLAHYLWSLQRSGSK